MITGKSWEKKWIVTFLSFLLFLAMPHLIMKRYALCLAESGVEGSNVSPVEGFEELKDLVEMLRAGDYAGILNRPEAGNLPERYEDFSLFLLSLAAYEMGEFDLGEKTRARLISDHPGSFLGGYLTVDVAYHLMKAGKLEEGRRHFGSGVKWEPLFHREGSRYFYVRGRALLAEGKMEEGVESLVDCVSRYPGTEPAMLAERIAITLLVEKGREKGKMDFSTQALNLGSALSGEGKFQDAERVLKSWRGRAGEKLRGKFDLALANALRRMNRYSEAIEILMSQGVGEPRAISAKKMFFAGIYTWYRGKTDEAEKILMRVLEEYENSDAAHKAAYNLGRISEESGRFEDAFAYYRMASKQGGSKEDYEVSFRMGLVKFLNGEYEEAEQVFSGNLVRFSEEEHYFRNLFLKAYSLEKKGDAESAEAIYRRILSEKKGGIYYFLALRKLGRSTEWNSIGNVPFKDVTSEVLLQRLLQDAREGGKNHRLERALMFQRLGLYTFSLEELSKADPGDIIPEGTARRAHQAITAYVSGNYRRGIELSIGKGSPQNFRGVHLIDSPNYLQYPALAFVINGARAGGVNPFLLHSILRQESLFDYGVVSSAGAIGLGQIMPQTGRWIAKQRGLHNFTMELLFDPVTNSSFATFYLENLIRLFEGDIVLAAAAYNAGEAAAWRWKKKSAGDPYLYPDIIGYEETRKYVRKVFMNYLYYLKVYADGWEDTINVK